jgi:DNA repair exonuclease SbcCD ATPase subunit
MPEQTRSNEPFLDLPEDESLPGEHLDTQVQKAQEQLLSLKRQQELIERQKRELEELSRRQEQLHVGRAEMIDKFTRALVVLERETYDAQKRVEQLQGIHESFSQHQQYLDSINPKSWEGLDMNKELTKALSAVDDARAEYNKSLPKVSPETDTDRGDPMAASAGFQIDYQGTEADHSFVYWLRAGFAFTLPLIVLGVVYIIVVLARNPVP